MTPIERAQQAIREVFERRAVEYGNWITEPHEVTKAWEYEGEIATDEIVRAVLQAIREPSEAMSSGAEFAELSFRSRGENSFDYLSKDNAADVWRRMIDAALAEGA